MSTKQSSMARSANHDSRADAEAPNSSRRGAVGMTAAVGAVGGLAGSLWTTARSDGFSAGLIDDDVHCRRAWDGAFNHSGFIAAARNSSAKPTVTT
jgi:hypothetical protein